MESIKYLLDGTWQLAYASHKEVTDRQLCPVSFNDIKAAGIPIINARVPGNV